MEGNRYDLVVIGSGPAGQKAAIAASKLQRRVAVVDRRFMMGGACVHAGTIPSKTLREAVLHFNSFRERNFYSRDLSLRSDISIQDLAYRVQAIVSRESAVILDHLERNGISVYDGTAEFMDPHTLKVSGEDRSSVIRGDFILIACGTRSAREPSICFDGVHVIDSDEIMKISAVPKEAIVIGAGVVGLEHASLLSALGSEVVLIEEQPHILDFVDHEIVEALTYHLRQRGTILRLGEKVASVTINDWQDRVTAELESGKKVHCSLLIYAAERVGNSDRLRLEMAGLRADSRGRLKVDGTFKTDVPHIYAAGDVIGFPALASTSMEQGRLASCHMFGLSCECVAAPSPYAIYTIPEISVVGQNEEDLTNAKVPYEVGLAKYSELAMGMMLGDENGMLKLLFDRHTRKLLGVHAIGERATEIIHVGQAILANGGLIDYFRDAVFNYPTLTEAYKVAALDGLNKL